MARLHRGRLRFGYRVFPQRDTWPACADDLGLDAEALVTRVRALAAGVPVAFAAAAASPEVTGLDRELPPRLVDLVCDRARRCTKLLDGAPTRTAPTRTARRPAGGVSSTPGG